MIERITRSLAFMLRHQPEQHDLELDAYGYADVGDVVRALNEKIGEPVREEDLREAVEAGDRVRYEIVGNRIRALYGHSIPVEPGDASKPPEFFYVAIPERDLDRAKRFGLRGGRRRFLHLALTEEDARATGRRGSVDYTILCVRALDAWEEGVNFYDRKSLWLAEEVPTHLIDVGETYHDGSEREPRGRPRERDDQSRGGRGRGSDSRGGRPGGRGRGRGGRGRDGNRERGRDGERSREDRPVEHAARSESRGDSRGESRGGSRSDSNDRGSRRGGGGPRNGQERESRDSRPSREPSREVRKEAPREPERPARKQPAASDGGGFGAGILNPKPQRERSSKASNTTAPKAPEPKREQKPEPPAQSGGSGFGAGL